MSNAGYIGKRPTDPRQGVRRIEELGIYYSPWMSWNGDNDNVSTELASASRLTGCGYWQGPGRFTLVSTRVDSSNNFAVWPIAVDDDIPDLVTAYNSAQTPIARNNHLSTYLDTIPVRVFINASNDDLTVAGDGFGDGTSASQYIYDVWTAYTRTGTFTSVAFCMQSVNTATLFRMESSAIRGEAIALSAGAIVTANNTSFYAGESAVAMHAANIAASDGNEASLIVWIDSVGTMKAGVITGKEGTYTANTKQTLVTTGCSVGTGTRLLTLKRISATEFLVAYLNASNYPTVGLISISGTTPSFTTTPLTLTSQAVATTAGWTVDVEIVDYANKVFMAAYIKSSNTKPYARVGQVFGINDIKLKPEVELFANASSSIAIHKNPYHNSVFAVSGEAASTKGKVLVP